MIVRQDEKDKKNGIGIRKTGCHDNWSWSTKASPAPQAIDVLVPHMDYEIIVRDDSGGIMNLKHIEIKDTFCYV